MKRIITVFSFLIICSSTSIRAQIIDSVDRTEYHIEKSELRTVFGDGQYQKVSKWLGETIVVQVTDEHSGPVENSKVTFSILSYPKKAIGFEIEESTVFTDSLGNASTRVFLGSSYGDYQLIARIQSSSDNNFQVFTFHARRSNWVFMLVIGLLGGLGLFLLGMEMMSEGMQKSAGNKLRTILSSLTSNRLLAVGLGTFVTMIIQSSSATSVMLVGFVNSKLMKFRKTIGIILGANIGTTITAQLIAFKLTDYSLLMVAIGFSLLYFTKRQKIKFVGQAILGFGILFFGMHIMSDSMYPMRTYTPFIELLQGLENPFIGILVGTIFTAILQSSSAFIGITIVLATQGMISLEAAIPLLLGSNIGTAITAFLAGINASREAKKVAMANAFINIFGMLLLLTWIPAYADLIERISPKSSLAIDDPMAMAELIPRQIANAHTVFNVLLAALVLPFTNILANIIDKILPEKEEAVSLALKTMYLDRKMASTPVLGMNLAKQEALRIGRITQDMLSDIILPFVTKQDHVLNDVRQKEELVDFLSEEVNSYLTELSRQEIAGKTADEAFQIMYAVKELEEIADIVGNLLVDRAYTWIENDVEFSEDGKKELLEYHILSQKQLSRALDVFDEVNLEKAKRMKMKHKKYRGIASELEKQHYARLVEPGKTLEPSGDSHMELMTRLRTVVHHATNIGRVMLDWGR